MSFDKNYASDKKIADQAQKKCLDILRQAKINRSAKEMEWLDDYKMWSCQPSDLEMFHGRSNLFVPELHHQIESTVAQYQAAMFPNDSYIKAIANKDTQHDEALKIEQAVYYELDVKNNFPTLMERSTRQKVLYGTSAIKCHFTENKKQIWQKDKKKKFKLIEAKNPQVKWDVCDMFHTYVYPEVVTCSSDLKCVFEETFVEVDKIKNNKNYVNKSDITTIENPEMFHWVDTIRMAVQNLSAASEVRPDSCLVTEFWIDLEIANQEVPCVVKIVNYNTVISIKRNPYTFQTAPYLFDRYLMAPAGEFYGRSLPERIRLLQAQMNDLTNQTMDSLNYALNPIAIIDPGFAGDVNSFKIAPGAKWFASPQGVQFASFPDISGSGFQGMQQVRGMIQQFSDLGIQVAPQLSGKVRSASQANIVAQQQNTDTRNMIRSTETDVLLPACQMTHMLLQQFMDDKYMIRVQGPANGEWITKEIDPSDLVGQVDYIWKGSDFANKDSVKNQQLIAFFDKALQIEQIIPGKVDLPALYKIVAKQVFDIPLNEVFTDDKQKFTVDPEIENIALMAGKPVLINEGDNVELHVESHIASLDKAIKKKDNEAIRVHMDHIKLHEANEIAKSELRQQEAQLEALAMGGETEQPLKVEEGNQFQSPNPSNPAQLMQGMRPVD